MIGVEPVTGRHFEPSSVAEKVKRRIENSDAFLAIITPQDDQTWIIQETTYAESKNKYPFLLVEQGTEMKQGLLGDREYINSNAVTKWSQAGCLRSAEARGARACPFP